MKDVGELFEKSSPAPPSKTFKWICGKIALRFRVCLKVFDSIIILKSFGGAWAKVPSAPRI